MLTGATAPGFVVEASRWIILRRCTLRRGYYFCITNHTFNTLKPTEMFFHKNGEGKLICDLRFTFTIAGTLRALLLQRRARRPMRVPYKSPKGRENRK